MQIRALSNRFAAQSRNKNGTDHSISRMISVSRKWMFWTVIVSFVSITNAMAKTLPDFSSLIAKEGSAVVKVSVVTSRTSVAESGFDLDQLPEGLRRYFEQMPKQQPQPRQGQGFGSGFIISEDGFIITNAHVVDGASTIRIGLQDQREFDAELIGSDKTTDIAVLKVKATGLPVVTMGNSDNVKVGEWVLAIGSPFGFEYSATQGIVSAVARDLPADTYVPFIQTDVAVNPGNSGGPLFNTEGEVIGVNSQIYSRSGGYQGLSFAIPINVAKNIADQLRMKGYASRGWLGVVIQDVDQALAESFGLTKPTGALIANVTADSPAKKSGLKSGDIIVEFNGKKVTRSGKLPPMVGGVAVGKSVEVIVLRDGSEKVINVTIEELETDRRTEKVSSRKTDDSNFGVVVGQLSEENREALGISNGVVISEVAPGSPAGEAGLVAGDVIVSLNREDVTGVEDFVAQVKKLPRDKSFPVLVQRGSASLFRAIKIPSTKE